MERGVSGGSAKVSGSCASRGSRGGGRGYKGRGQRVKEWTTATGGVYRKPFRRSVDGDSEKGRAGGGERREMNDGRARIGRGRGVVAVRREIEQRSKGKVKSVENEIRAKAVNRKKSEHVESGSESYDSGVERLDRYLSAQFRIDSEEEEEDEGGFFFGGEDPTQLTELSSRDCLPSHTTATFASITTSAPTSSSLQPSSLQSLPAPLPPHPFAPSLQPSSITEPAATPSSTKSGGNTLTVSTLNTGQSDCPSFAPFEDTSEQSGNEFDKFYRPAASVVSAGYYRPVSAQFEDCTDKSQDEADLIDHPLIVDPMRSEIGCGRVERDPSLIEEDDDGWNSDSNDFCSQIPSRAAQPTQDLPPYAIYEDDVWVDEAKAVFSRHKKENSKELDELFREMFALHTDVYSLMLAFVKRAGKTRHPAKSLPRLAFAAFLKWLKQLESGEEVEPGDQGKNRPPNPPVLRDTHKEEVLELMTRSHLTIMEDLCNIFQLHSADTQLLVDLVDNLLLQGMRKEAVTYAWTFHLQSHFPLDDMLLPLIAMDKINLIESYIEGDVDLQEDFVMLLDRLCTSGGLASYTKRLDIEVNTPNNKFCLKQMYKMALRMVNMFNLQLGKFPGLSSQRLVICLHHLLKMKYISDSITEDNMADLVAAAVQANPGLPQLLVRELIRMGQKEAAAHWARVYHLPSYILPIDIQIIVADGSRRARVGLERQEKEEASSDCLQFPLSVDSIHFVSDSTSLARCKRKLTQKGALIGVDAEWRLPICNGWDERMALLQLAVRDSVYLLDMLALPLSVPQSQLTSFFRAIFSNTATIKLGYSITGDLDLLARSLPFVAKVLKSPARVVDIKTLAAMVEDQLMNSCPQPPPHPLLGKTSCPPATIQTPSTHNRQTPDTTCTPSEHKQQENSEHLGLGGSLEGDPDDDPLNSENTRGLSRLVQKELGKPLDKSQQISDWEKRPLSPAQLKYASLDALCLLDLYVVLTAKGLAVDPNFNIEPCISPLHRPSRPSQTQTDQREHKE